MFFWILIDLTSRNGEDFTRRNGDWPEPPQKLENGVYNGLKWDNWDSSGLEWTALW